MLNLDQVRLLENRVEKAVGKIQTLTAENTHLRSQLSGLQARVNELEGLVRAFKDDQGRIEEGILSALDRLSAFEDTVFKQDVKPAIPETPVTIDAFESESITSAATIPEAPIETVPSAIGPDTIEATPSIPEELSDMLDINADWEEEEKKPAANASSSDGQMDIF
jgi:chromosome segregation ATPase